MTHRCANDRCITDPKMHLQQLSSSSILLFVANRVDLGAGECRERKLAAEHVVIDGLTVHQSANVAEDSPRRG